MMTYEDIIWTKVLRIIHYFTEKIIFMSSEKKSSVNGCKAILVRLLKPETNGWGFEWMIYKIKSTGSAQKHNSKFQGNTGL